MTDRNLDRAYGLSNSTETRALHRDWAETCDGSFGTAKGYVVRRDIARLKINAEYSPTQGDRSRSDRR
ncbi:hypothetical protein [Actibacterium sp. 188UL27-1]|uniref:hypothetical protein n=1 Tax=Actibacterium sp. 188UL27-1 TaxID=2786961 RepID=UPI00195B9D43|nr:hypothetical protein [Actibacterium sp. 188UL27-1]MBM7066795.1 hypothetical protein [Actibacterium sp. 188UL27-1]